GPVPVSAAQAAAHQRAPRRRDDRLGAGAPASAPRPSRRGARGADARLPAQGPARHGRPLARGDLLARRRGSRLRPMTADDLLTHLARFAGALRERKISVGLSDEIDAAGALTLVDLSDREEVRTALRIAMKSRRRDAEAFDSLFDLLWRDRPAEVPVDPAARRSPDRANAGRRIARAPHPPEGETEMERPQVEGEEPGYSPEALLRGKPFEECSPADLAAMEKLLARLALRLATRRSRRLVPVRGRGILDPRRSLRRALATEGEMLRFARRSRAVEEPRLVVLCDTSGSMDSHTRFLLTFLLSLAKTTRRTEIFAFNTALTRLTPWLSAGRIERALERLA